MLTITTMLSFLELLPNPPHVSASKITVTIANSDNVNMFVQDITATSRDENNNIVQTSGLIDTGGYCFSSLLEI